MSRQDAPILFAREWWQNSQMSVARLTGRIKAYGHEYWVVDRYGRSIFSTSIAEGEPADLVRHDFITCYAALGRDEFLKTVKEGPRDDKELLRMMKQLAEERKEKKEKKASPVEGSLF